MRGSRGVNVLLIVLGVVFVVVGVIGLPTHVVSASFAGVGGVLMVTGGAIALIKSRKSTT